MPLLDTILGLRGRERAVRSSRRTASEVVAATLGADIPAWWVPGGDGAPDTLVIAVHPAADPKSIASALQATWLECGPHAREVSFLAQRGRRRRARARGEGR